VAISSGVRQHTASLSVGGQTFLVTKGSVEQTATRQSASFSVELPLTQVALSTFANLGQNQASINVSDGSLSAELISGEIDNVGFDLVNRIIGVQGRDTSAKLHEQKSAEKWPNRKPSDIVQDLAQRVGLQAQIDASILKAGRLVSNDWAKLTDGVSFAAVIHKMAEFEGARWFVKGSTLYFQSKDNPGGTYTLNYRQSSGGGYITADFLRLTVGYNVQAGKTANVTVKSWHSSKKKLLEHKATIQGSTGQTSYTYHIPGLTQDHVEQYAKKKALEHTRHEYTIRAECVGDPSIDVAMSLQLTGTQYFDQQYAIDEIHHRFGMDGHSMEIHATSKKQGRSVS
jgi:phage protein D